jgi:hypothetical protein
VKLKRKLYPDLMDIYGEKVKKPTSPFLEYYAENYARISSKFPNTPHQDLMRCISKEWKSLPRD